jgi:peptide deformylase
VQIVKYPHPTLRRKSKPLCRVDSEVKKAIREMFDLMYADKGIGLASNQVDLPYRLFIMNVQGDPAASEEEFVFINPVITSRKGGAEDREGCLSFPEIFAPVRRPAKISVNAYALDGRELSYEMDGLYARAFQHELDHLEGVLFVDRLSQTNLMAVKEELDDLEQEFKMQRRLKVIGSDEEIAARLLELEAAVT